MGHFFIPSRQTFSKEEIFIIKIKNSVSRFFAGAFSRSKNIVSKYIKLLLSRDADGNLSVLSHIRFYIMLSLFVELVVECLCRHSVKSGFVFLLVSFFVFCFNALIIFLTYIPAFFIRRKLFYTTFMSLVWIGLGVGNCIVTLCRITPLSVIDFLNLPSVFSIIGIYLSTIEIVLICIAIALALAFVVFLAIKAPKSRSFYKRSIIAALCSILLLPMSYSFGISAKMLSDQFSSLPAAYKSYGFPYCFCTSVIDRGIETPKDYSVNKMDEILGALNSHNTTAPNEKPNIVFVQLESFFDVNDLLNIRFSEDPIPNFTSLSERGISGYLTVPVLGAGTVNSEFEVLTGMSVNVFGAGEHPYKTVLGSYSCESIAYNLMELGYSTHAIHNYQGTFYQRHKVYKNLGFQSYTPLEYMSDVEYNISGAWPKDDILTSQIFDALSSTDGSDFVMTVTVQGHGKYPPNVLPEDYDPKIQVEFIDGLIEGGLSDINGLSYYVNQLYETDLFIDELVRAIDAFDEKTILVLYGDHLPSLSIEDSDLKSGSIYKTPYLILSNYGIEDSAIDFGDMYSYQLAASVLELADIHNGLMTKLHQYYRDSSNYYEWFRDLEYDMIGYNLLGGISPRYVYGGNTEYYPKMETMRLGVKDIVIRHCEMIDGVLYVYGENFTEWSRLVADGDVISATKYIANDLIAVELGEDKELPSKIAVAQMGDGGVKLGQTSEMLTVSVDPDSEIDKET